MADGNFPTLVSATRDANILTNPIFVKLTDGTTAVSLTGTSIDVNITGGASSGTEYAEDAAHVSGDLGQQLLAVRQDTLAASTSTDGDYTPLKTTAAGALYVNFTNTTIAVTATDLDIRDLVFATDKVDVSGSTLGANSGIDIGDVTINNAAGAAAVNIQDGGNSITIDGTVTANAGTGPFPVSDNGGSLTVDAVALDIRTITKATDSIQVSANTAVNSETNPIFVQTATAVSGNEVHSYNTASAVAADTASNHSYTVVGTTFLLKSVIGAFSGGGKVEIQTGPVASLVTRAVAFVPKEGGHVQLEFNPPIEVPVTSTGTVRVIRTNRQGQAQDVYSTIIGNDLP